jgi:threonyl-tRNA synthetase
VPIADAHLEYAKEIQRELNLLEIDSEISSKNESLNKRIRNAEKQRVPMILVLGDEEVAKKSVALRDRRERKQYNLTKEEFYNKIKEKMNEVHF